MLARAKEQISPKLAIRYGQVSYPPPQSVPSPQYEEAQMATESEKHGVFISHSSTNLEDAKQFEAALTAAGFDPWLDKSDIRVGALLGKELQQAIEGSRAVVLIWSVAAHHSPWVTTEILTAFQLDRFILPYALDATELPQILSKSIYGDLRKDRASVLEKLGRDVSRAPQSRNEFPGSVVYQTVELQEQIYQLADRQMAVTDCLGRDDLAGAEKLQRDLDPSMSAAESQWKFDPTILNLSGYHKKNAYMIAHWAEYCAGRYPKDPLLDEGRSRFFETLLINPIEYSALNGLGNIFLFQGELNAAEFFVSCAIRCSQKAGVDYWQAKNDLKIIQSRLNASA